MFILFSPGKREVVKELFSIAYRLTAFPADLMWFLY